MQGSNGRWVKDHGAQAVPGGECQEPGSSPPLGEEWKRGLEELKKPRNAGSLSQVDLVDSSGVVTIRVCISTTRTVKF